MHASQILIGITSFTRYFYSAVPGDDSWAAIYVEETYQKKILQPDGETEKDMDITEAVGLKHAIETGKKPDCGLWLGGVKYNITRYESDFEVNDQTLQVLFCQRPKGGALIAKSGSQIVAGFYDEEKGQNAGNCKKATTDFAAYLKSIDY